MKLIKSFEKFLKDEVNLNPDRINTAEEKFATIKKFLLNNEVFGTHIKDVSKQGSFRQKTIIKPVQNNDEFDVDLLFLMDKIEGWEAKDYLNKLHQEFKKSEIYKDIVDRVDKKRCVTIDYSGDFHVDVIPSVPNGDIQSIMNKVDNVFEPTDGDGYAFWFEEKNNFVGNDNLIKTVRLLKYIRDDKNTFSVKSVLLTTLLGYQVQGDESEDTFSDLPTTFKILVNRLNDFLQMYPIMPIVTNPVLESEDFNRHWNQEKYENFREKIEFYNDKINIAFESDDLNDSLKFWQKVFGDKFNLAEEDEEVFVNSVTGLSLGDTSHQQPFPGLIIPKYKVEIECIARKFGREKKIDSKSLLMKGYDLKYIAHIEQNADYDEVRWQVVNTGEEAHEDKGLRGKFFYARNLDASPSNNPRVNYERTTYHGVHWIQCFFVKNDRCVGRSEKFYIGVINPRRLAKFRLR